VVLSTPSKLFPVKLASVAPGPGVTLTAVGFGIDEKAGGPLPPPGRPQMINRSLKYTTLRTSADACTSPPKGTLCAVGLRQLGGVSGTCAGDSGGPELNSNGQQVSVTSYGPDVDCGVGAWAVYTSIPDYYVSFIKPAIDKYAPGGVDNGGNPSPTPPNNGGGNGGGNNGGGGNGGGGNGGGGNGGGGNGGGGNGGGGNGGGGDDGDRRNGGGSSGNSGNVNSSTGGSIEDESDDSESSGSGTGGSCIQWTWNSVGNQRIMYGTPVNGGFNIKVINSIACGNKCGATPGCNSFNYQRGTRKCSMFEEGAGTVETVRDNKYVAGYLTCGERRRKCRQ
jgi:Trypsin